LDNGQIEVVDDAVAEVLRRMTPAERVQVALEANDFVRLAIAGHLATIHPDWTDAQIQAEVARRMLRESD
jgi:hypothetical protein